MLEGFKEFSESARWIISVPDSSAYFSLVVFDICLVLFLEEYRFKSSGEDM